eukprot:CAMPEP_0194030702 /NCGR_PEP_ID=MMETSP0009_2-20130614/4077_1 /TAXON_ID=210454 /ORGANISM="Grammatophora oceanica, Strain CCMP 410" /LENGTH=224 /DNA_ID=CAMNT_0038670687 /DNA_START=86 /DNA_END=760 /DNA_ORIENTATION=+
MDTDTEQEAQRPLVRHQHRGRIKVKMQSFRGKQPALVMARFLMERLTVEAAKGGKAELKAWMRRKPEYWCARMTERQTQWLYVMRDNVSRRMRRSFCSIIVSKLLQNHLPVVQELRDELNRSTAVRQDNELRLQRELDRLKAELRGLKDAMNLDLDGSDSESEGTESRCSDDGDDESSVSISKDDTSVSDSSDEDEVSVASSIYSPERRPARAQRGRFVIPLRT